MSYLVKQTMKMVHMSRKERRSTVQNFLRTPTVMALLYQRTPQRYKAQPPDSDRNLQIDYISLFEMFLFFSSHVTEFPKSGMARGEC